MPKNATPKQPYSPTQCIRPLVTDDLKAVVDLSLLAWEPVFVSFENILGASIFGRLYRPDWRSAQAAAVEAMCLADDVEAFVIVTSTDVIAGFMALQQHEAEATGQVQMIAVHPQHQRRGHARALMEFAIQRFRERGLALVNVGTGGDPGHAPARALYEAVGFTGVPLVNYYLALDADEQSQEVSP